MNTAPVPIPRVQKENDDAGVYDQLRASFVRWMGEHVTLSVKRSWLAGATALFLFMLLLALD